MSAPCTLGSNANSSEFTLLMERIDQLRKDIGDLKTSIDRMASEKREEIGDIYQKIADIQSRVSVLESAKSIGAWILCAVGFALIGIVVKLIFANAGAGP